MSLKLPAATRAADLAACQAQKRYRRAIIASLALLVVASVGGAITKPWGGWVSAGAFTVAVLLTLVSVTVSWHRTWCDGRAAAEAGTTLSWRFAVGGAPFPLGDQDAAKRFHDRLARLDKIGDAPPAAQGLTPADLRDLELAQRRATYRACRLHGQITWYRRRAGELRSQAAAAGIGAGALQIAGLAGAILKGLDKTDVDWLALSATAAAAVTAWRAVDDDVRTAAAYDRTANELEELGDAERRIDSESAWAAFVDDAEAVMAGEHGVWVARRR